MQKRRYDLLAGRLSLTLLSLLLFSSPVVVATVNTSITTDSPYSPIIPFEENLTWKYHLNMSGGYPLVPHEFGPFTDEDWNALDEDQNQTVTIIRYFNSQTFPNETVYGFFHQELKFVLWVKEIQDKKTGITSLAQVGETPKDTYNANITAAENDYLGNIEWFIVNQKLYPRTWIKGHLSDGMNWTEYWGPFTEDDKGSVLRERKYSVQSEQVTILDKQYDGFAVRTEGPGEKNEYENVIETLHFVDGIGPTGRDIIAKTTRLTPLPKYNGWPASLPANSMIFDHSARIVSVNTIS